jgi:pilus assembly protein TadC
LTAGDSIIVGTLMLAGSLILIRSLDGVMRSGLVPQLGATLMRLHEKANRLLIEKRIFRFPGVNLVTSLRGWLAAELILCATVVLSLSLNFSFGNAIISLFLGALLGVSVLFLSVKESARKQIDCLRSTLPVASFLLSLMMEAGMGSSAALQEVVRALPKGPLSGELEGIARSRLLGVSRDEAIEKSRSRVPLDDYRTFLNIISQGERLGIALSQGLRELSSRMMESQGHRAETLAQKAAVKLLFPLVIFIFPSVFLIILSPVILNLWDLLGS